MKSQVAYRFTLNAELNQLHCQRVSSSDSPYSSSVAIETLSQLLDLLRAHSEHNRSVTYSFNISELALALGSTAGQLAAAFASTTQPRTELTVTGAHVDRGRFFHGGLPCGLLPAAGSFRDSRTAALRLHKADYVVRQVADDDLDRLWQLECQCWEEHQRSTKRMLEVRMRTYPAGNFVAERDGEILGVIYSQRINDISALYERTWRDVSTLHNEQGKLGQLIVLNVNRQLRANGIGAQLLTTALLGLRLQDVRLVYGVTLTRRLDKYREVDFAEYLKCRDASGVSVDPVLRFHTANGANILGLVPNFRPGDVDNGENGILIQYDISMHT